MTPTLDQVLDSTAHRIAEHGTRSEATLLEELAGAASELCAVAAAALVDWESGEVARLRAYGIVHGVLLRDHAAVDRHVTGARVAALAGLAA